MSTSFFFAVTSVLAVLAIAIEFVIDKRRKTGWHSEADTVGNLLLASGNLLLGGVLVLFVGAGYALLYRFRIVDLPDRLPKIGGLVLAVVLSDFLQYWNHRLSHRWSLLWWGHVTHHSSAHFNLSTGIRINWLYRSYAWLLYAPMPLLGFSFEAFVLGQTTINVYNLFMHTRFDVPFGPLAKILVTPLSHRLHHSANPRYFGNYGALFIVWDRMFGTYREAAADAPESELAYGIGRNVDSANPMRLNFHYLADLWTAARGSLFRFLRLVLGLVPKAEVEKAFEGAERSAPALAWLSVLVIVLLALLAQRLGSSVSRTAEAGCVLAGILFALLAGAAVDRARASRARR